MHILRKIVHKADSRKHVHKLIRLNSSQPVRPTATRQPDALMFKTSFAGFSV